MKKIKGFHFVYEVHKPASAKPGSGLEIARITGDVNAEGNMQATIDVTQAGIPLQLKFVVVGDTHYIQDPLSQKWQAIPAKDSPVGTLSLSAGTIRILDRITDTSYVGTENKQGVKTYHIKGKVAAQEVAAIAGAVSVTGTFPTDIWVGINDGLVYEVDIAGAATPNEDPKIWRSIVLSNLDTFVDIKAPQ
ncbi:MAG: LppX_LprAFG lipoprotein, partial [Thermoleophilia bacterium]|nr:LppX_LprAFG lipoprotein [Thermoleophilia bacterium]